MTVIQLLLVSAAGGCGALLRFTIDVVFPFKTFPWATFLVNITGSFFAGLAVGWAGQLLPIAFEPYLVTGFLGGFTTMSAVSVQTVQLVSRRRMGLAVVVGFGQVVAAVIAATTGVLLAGL